MKTTEITNWKTGAIIHSGEFMSVRDCLEDGARKGISFAYADLSNLNLRGMYLRGVSLCFASFRDADLKGASLINVDLHDANLRGSGLRLTSLINVDLTDTDIRGASLKDAYLKNVNLWSTIGNGREIKTLQTTKYICNYTKNVLQIGCERHSFEEWLSFSDDEIAAMDELALDWWNQHKGWIFKTIEINPAC